MSKVKYTYNISDLIETVKNEKPIPEIWNGIKEGSFGYIYGPSKSGKTIFCENLAFSLATNQEQFLGYMLPEIEQSVLFISMEEYVRPRTERNAKQMAGMDLMENQTINLKVIGERFPRFFASNDDWKILEETIVESEADIVFIDSLTRLSDGDIERSSHARDVSQQLRELNSKLGKTMIVIHHTPKLEGKIITLDSLAGSRVLAQDADFLIGINKSPLGTRYIKEVAFRYKQENDESVLPFIINNSLWIDPLAPVEEQRLFQKADLRRDDSKLNKVRDVIYEFTESNNTDTFSSGTIVELTKDEMHYDTTYIKIGDLMEDGEISKISKGKYKINNISRT